MNHEALEKYAETVAEKSRRKNVARARAYLKWLGTKEPSKRNIIKYRDLLAERYSSGMIKQDMTIIQKLHRINEWPWNFNRGELITVRELDVDRPTLGIKWLEEMVDVVLGRKASLTRTQPSDLHRALLCVASVYGLRRQEVQAINQEWIDAEALTIFIETAKGGRQRYHLIPAFALPHLMGWGFKTKLSISAVDTVFRELKEMVGLTGVDGRGVGWHAVRRGAIHYAGETRQLSPLQIHNFYRWRSGSVSMVDLYTSGRLVDKDHQATAVPIHDADLDRRMFTYNPFVQIWNPAKEIGDA